VITDSDAAHIFSLALNALASRIESPSMCDKITIAIENNNSKFRVIYDRRTKLSWIEEDGNNPFSHGDVIETFDQMDRRKLN
jgi:hypothetical protein